MRLARMFGVAALGTAIALALMGTSTASATFNTQLCNQHTTLVCGNPTSALHLVSAEPSKLLSSLATVLCLSLLLEATPLGLATAPSGQLVHALSATLTGCGTNSTHTNCTVTVNQLPLFNLLKLGLDEGTLKATNGLKRLRCENIFGFIDIDCEYDLTGLLMKFGGQHLTANKTPFGFVEGEGPCPENNALDALLETLSETKAYVLS